MYKEQLGSKLRFARDRAGYSQEQIAEIMKISQSQISKLEKGIQEPNIELLGKLIDFYEISADWLLGTNIANK